MRSSKFSPAGPYTTGQLAKLFSVSPRTVTIWCERHGLACYRLPGLFADRRITRNALIEFFKQYPDVPWPEALGRDDRVVDVGTV